MQEGTASAEKTFTVSLFFLHLRFPALHFAPRTPVCTFTLHLPPSLKNHLFFSSFPIPLSLKLFPFLLHPFFPLHHILSFPSFSFTSGLTSSHSLSPSPVPFALPFPSPLLSIPATHFYPLSPSPLHVCHNPPRPRITYSPTFPCSHFSCHTVLFSDFF